ncbi:pregnancy-specific beta-1-glycoprotein 2-like [Aquarana catesbeiana]|uniref:pregnancy-specific beta-1-glycoprotein 2-like n=1 Tax=Aquarana catesbeiana TaxID=8400 RepID=UPI003CC9CE16
MGFAILTATLLLIQYGNAANLIITSPNASPTVLTGDPINLNISYNSTPTLIIWQYGNGILMATWINGTGWSADNYKNRLTLHQQNISIGNSATKDSGEYTVTVTDTNRDSGSFKFNVVVRERVLEIQSNDTGIYRTGANISLTIWYDGNPSEIFWFYNGNPFVIKTENNEYISDRIRSRMVLQENGSLLIYNTTKDDAGNYSINVTATTTITTTNTTTIVSGSQRFQVKFYDPVGNVTVKQSLQVVSEDTSAVNVTCSASSGYNEAVTWMKAGESITNSTYNLLDGNQTLQIMQPNRTFSGNYSCNISNAVSWSIGYLQLLVYDPLLTVTVTQSPQKVNEGAAFVNLGCSASSGYTEMVTWMKDGQSVISKNAYSLLDGNRTLQITQPNRTFNGLYICNVSNAAYWGSGSLNLTVSYATLRATSTYSIMIIPLLGGILLAHW